MMSNNSSDALLLVPAASAPVVDVSPAYELLVSLRMLVAHSNHLKEMVTVSHWRAWQEETARGLTVEQWRRAQRWFGDPTDAIGLAYMALIPTLAPSQNEPKTIEQFLRALAELPLADFLRVAVTSAMIDPSTPLGADDLLALTKDRALANRFVEQHLRLTARQRRLLLSILAEPEAERADLLATLQAHSTQVYSVLEPQLRGERERAAERLRALVATTGRAPEWLGETAQLVNFAPVVLAPVSLLDRRQIAYYHEVRRSLFDGLSYEPFIIMVGAQKILAPPLEAPMRRQSTLGRISDPLERWATVYAALGDPSRLRIVRLLAERPHYGQELAAKLRMSGATISHHLDALSRIGVLWVERRAHRTYFTLRGEALAMLLRGGEQFVLRNDEQERQEGEAPC